MSGSTTPSRPRLSSRSQSRQTARSGSPVYFPASGVDPTDIVPDGPIIEDNADIIDDLIHRRPHVHREETAFEVEDEDEEEDDHDAVLDEQREQRRRLPWWKRANPWWYILAVPFSTAASFSTVSPRIAVVTDIVCDAVKRERDHNPDWDSEKWALSIFSRSLPSEVPRAFVSSNEPTDFSTDTLLAFRTNDTEYAIEKPIVCASDPTVQAGVAKVLAWMTTTTGILSCITTGFWGSLSDRRGRTFVAAFAAFGLCIQDVNFLTVTHFPDRVPGGYNALLFGTLIEGLFGGLPTSAAAIHAYLADCSTPATRSHTFSRFLGMMFIGLTLGPTIGSLVIRLTGSNFSVFYIAATVHFTFLVYNGFILPESLFPEQMALSRKKYLEDLGKQRREVGLFAHVKRLFGFLTPLIMLGPVHVDNAGAVSSSWSRKGRRDWNLTFTAIAFGAIVTILGASQITFQYASAQFGWSPVELGFFLSGVGLTRAIFLSAVLPFVIKYLKPKPPSIRLPVSPSEPLSPTRPSFSRSISQVSRPVSTSRTRSTRTVEDHDHPHYNHAVARFDLNVARGSVVIECLVYAVFPFAASAALFVATGACGSFAAGFNPTVQSLALEFYRKRGGTEAGKLYGAMSVISALCQNIIGPSMFGYIYIKTVATFPQTYFFVGFGLSCVSLIMLLCVRPMPPPDFDDVEEQGDEGNPNEEDVLIPEIVVQDADDVQIAEERAPN